MTDVQGIQPGDRVCIVGLTGWLPVWGVSDDGRLILVERSFGRRLSYQVFDVVEGKGSITVVLVADKRYLQGRIAEAYQEIAEAGLWQQMEMVRDVLITDVKRTSMLPTEEKRESPRFFPL